MSDETKAVGRCACGAVKYVATLPVKFCSHCHCRECRAVHGAAFVTWFGVPLSQFRLGGKEHLRWYVIGGRDTSKRGFCGKCGTPILFLSTHWPDEVHITRASVVNEVDIAPKFHIFFDRHVDWFPFEDQLPHLTENGTELVNRARKQG